MIFRKEVLTRLLINIEMNTIDSIIQVTFTDTTGREYKNIAKHTVTVTLDLYLPYCVNRQIEIVILTMDGLETVTVWR